MRFLAGSVAAVCLLLAKSELPDFSGTWKLSVDQSNFGSASAPASLVSRIAHAEPSLQVRSEVSGPQGEYVTEYKWITGGRENVNTVRGTQIHTRAVWEGAVLVVTSVLEVNAAKFSLRDRWSLSPDRRILTVARTIAGPAGEGNQTYVYQRIDAQ